MDKKNHIMRTQIDVANITIERIKNAQSLNEIHEHIQWYENYLINNFDDIMEASDSPYENKELRDKEFNDYINKRKGLLHLETIR